MIEHTIGVFVRVAGQVKDVGRAVLGAADLVERPGPDQCRAAVQGDRVTENVAWRSVRGGQLGLLRPAVGCADEYVRGAGVGPARGIVGICPNERDAVLQRDRTTKHITCCCIEGCQLGLLRPHAAGAGKHVCGPGAPGDPDHCHVAVQCDRMAKAASIIATQLRLLRPDSARPGKHEGRAAANVTRFPDYGCVGLQRNGAPKLVPVHCVRIPQSGLLGPRPGRANKHVRRAGRTRVHGTRPGDRRVAVHCDRVPKSRSTRGCQLGLLNPHAAGTDEYVRCARGIRPDHRRVVANGNRTPEVARRRPA